MGHGRRGRGSSRETRRTSRVTSDRACEPCDLRPDLCPVHVTADVMSCVSCGLCVAVACAYTIYSCKVACDARPRVRRVAMVVGTFWVGRRRGPKSNNTAIAVAAMYSVIPHHRTVQEVTARALRRGHTARTPPAPHRHWRACTTQRQESDRSAMSPQCTSTHHVAHGP